MKPENKQLDRAQFKKLIQSDSIESLSLDEIINLFRNEKDIHNYKPEGIVQTDPRNNEKILFNPERAARPHNYASRNVMEEQTCPICSAQTTGVLDWVGLSEGFTFINKNLYPAVMPEKVKKSRQSNSGAVDGPSLQSNPAYGLHFIQWTSSLHEKDWRNLPVKDCVVVMERLAALEKKLLTESKTFMPATPDNKGVPEKYGFVSIIKNVGRAVGGSLPHGHQQIVFSNVMPRRMYEHLKFKQQQGMIFSEYMLGSNPEELIVHDYGRAVLIVPYFMRRPFDMQLILRDTGKSYCHELDEIEIEAVSRGWKDATRAIHQIMADSGKEVAYNVVTHNGPGAGLYFEFLPYTQEDGGLERLGLSICQADPYKAAAQLRRIF